MSCSNCGFKTDCPVLSLLASIVLGIIVAFLRFNAVITLTPAFLWVVFGIAVVYLLVVGVVTRFWGPIFEVNCRCMAIKIILFGALGTILTSLLLLGITFVATSVAGAIFSGLLLFFFVLLIFGTACLTLCQTSCGNREGS